MKQKDFLATLIGNLPRARIMRVFIFNEAETLNLASLGKRAGITRVTAIKELRALEEWGLVKRDKRTVAAVGTTSAKKPSHATENVWTLNSDFEYTRAISTLVHELSPAQFDTVTNVLKRAGKVATIVLSGSFMGDPTRPADLLVAADEINKHRLETALKLLEQTFGREIRYAAFTTPEFRYRLTVQDRLIRDTLDFPHVVLLDRTRML
jgi:predicted transcriptional regulator